MKKNVTKVLVTLLVILAVICLLGSMYSVAENEYACVVRFAKIVDTIDTAGLHFKIPFIDNIRFFPRDVQLYDINPSEVLTSDKKNMTVDSYVLWEISDPLTFFQTVGTLGEAERRLDAATYTTLKNVMGTLEQNAIINQEDGGERNKIYDSIGREVAEITTQYGINVVDVKIKRLDLPSDNEQAVYSRMISERNQIAEKYRADGEYEASIIINDVDKQVNIIISDAQAEAAKLEAEGEAEYMRMLAEAFNTEEKKNFYQFTLALDALRASLTGQDKTVVLGADADLVKMLISPAE
ncbi:MAG: protease modulator HflC [Ruminococcaceae bacterium]|nr:protease modulator HflC [Oscillospiraceae bacterium]